MERLYIALIGAIILFAVVSVILLNLSKQNKRCLAEVVYIVYLLILLFLMVLYIAKFGGLR